MKQSCIALLAFLALVQAGCLKPEPVIYRVSLGMTEEKLLEAVGPPVSRSSDGGVQTLEFRSWGSDPRGRPSHPTDWYVQLVNGKVSAYGRRPRPRPSAEAPSSSLV